MGTLRRATRRRRPHSRSNSRVVPRRPRHALRRRHAPLPQRPHELGVHLRALARSRVALRIHSAHAPLRTGVVRPRRERRRIARRMQRPRATHSRPRPPRQRNRRVRRALLVFATPAYFIGAVAWLALDRRVSRQAFTELSSANTADEGVSLAYKYRASSGREVSQLTRPVDANAIPRDAVIFRFVELGSPLSFRDDIPDIDDDDPNLTDKSKKKKPLPPKKRPPATALLSDDEEEWVRRGGRFVLGTADSYGPLKVRGLTIKTARKAFPIWSGLDELALPDPRGLDGDPLRRAHALYVAGNDIVIARQTIGAGELILIATPELFTNKHIGRGNHLALLAALAGAERPVFFDELPHGLGGDAGFVAMLKEWNLGPFLLLL